jgi:hypothetical protein
VPHSGQPSQANDAAPLITNAPASRRTNVASAVTSASAAKPSTRKCRSGETAQQAAAVTIVVAKTTSAVPRWAVTSAGVSSNSTVNAPRAIWTSRSATARSAGTTSQRWRRKPIQAYTAVAAMPMLTSPAV